MPILESLFNKVADLKAGNLIPKRLQHRCFLVNVVKFQKFLRTTFLQNTSGGCFIVNICYFKFQISKRVLLIEMMKFSNSQSKFIII